MYMLYGVQLTCRMVFLEIGSVSENLHVPFPPFGVSEFGRESPPILSNVQSNWPRGVMANVRLQVPNDFASIMGQKSLGL